MSNSMNMISKRELLMQKKQLKEKELESLNQELQMFDNQVQLMEHLHDSDSMRERQVEVEKLMTDENRNLRLRFRNGLPQEIETGIDIKSKEHTSIEVELIDAAGQVVTSGPEAFSTVEMVALRGDDEGPLVHCTTEEFNQRIISIWGKDKKPLLRGELLFNLNAGIGTVGNIKFRHCKDWMKQSKFMLGARDVNKFTGFPIKEAKTEPFKIKDCRLGRYNKHATLTMEDEIFRLENISYKGPVYPRLQKKGINTMKDFLHWLFKDSAELKLLLRWSLKKFEATINKAQKGMINDKLCCFSALDGKMVVFDFVNQVLGVVLGGQYYHFQGLSDEQKENAQKLAIHALQHWKDVCFVDSTSAKLKMIEAVLLSDDTDPPEKYYAYRIEVMVEEYHGVLIQDSITNGVPSKCSKPWVFMIYVLTWKSVIKKNTSTKRGYPLHEASTVGKKQRIC